MKRLQLWEIDGEDLIVAKSERDMRKIYFDYHGISIRGHERRLIPPDEQVEVTVMGDKTWKQPASELAISCGYLPSFR